MEIKIYKRLSDAKDIDGLGVVIDVFRATTTIACLIQARAEKVIVLPDANQIKNFISKPDHICFSEVVSEGFDNSPLTALPKLLKGKTAVISTANGTKSIIACRNCEQVITASFVNIDAVVEYLIEIQPPKISILAAGIVEEDKERMEDSLCAETLRNRLTGIAVDQTQIRKILLNCIKNKNKDMSDPEEYSQAMDFVFSSSYGILEVVPSVIYGDQIYVVNSDKLSKFGNENQSNPIT